MKKVLCILTLLCAVVAGAWAEQIQFSTSYSKPEHLYYINGAGNQISNYFWNRYTSPTSNVSNKAVFAFYGNEDNCYIYCVTTSSFVGYQKQSSYASGQQKVVLNVEKDGENYNSFKFAYTSSDDYYMISPYRVDNNSASNWLNWHGGIGSADNQYSLDSEKKIGLYDGSTDQGSKWRAVPVSKLNYYGGFIRIHGYDDASSKYFVGENTNNNKLKVGSKEENTIFYYLNGKLISYSNGQYVGFMTESNGVKKANLAQIGGTAATIAIEADAQNDGCYLVRVNGDTQWIGSSSTEADGSAGERHGQGWRLQIEEAESLPVNLVPVAGANYASFHAPVAVTIPNGISAYTGEIESDVLKLSKVDGSLLPAYSPVILYSNSVSGTVNLNITDSNEYPKFSDLSGTVAAESAAEGQLNYGAYVLNKSGDNVGFYKTTTKINGFKAYLPASAVQSGVQKFSFNFNEEMTTAIRAIESENSGAEIFDINGNRLKKAQKGMNIINGHKVIIK